MLIFHSSFDLQIFFLRLTATIRMSAWSVQFLAFSLLYTRYQESQTSLAVSKPVMLWLSGVVVNRIFTSGHVDKCACLLFDHCHVAKCFYLCVKFSRLVSTTKIVFNSELFPIHGIVQC